MLNEAFVRPGDASSVRKPARKGALLTARLALLPLILIAAGRSPLAAAPPPVYVTNAGGDSVTVIDPATNGVVTTITVGSTPASVAVSPSGERVYVANQGSANVSVIDAASNSVVATVPVGYTLIDIIVAPDGTRVYVADSAGIHIIDAATNNVVGLVAVSGAYGIAISGNGARLYVADPTSSVVTVIDTASASISATIPIGPGAASIDLALTPDGSRLYVSNASANSVSVVSTATNQIVQTIPFVHPANPIGLAMTPDGAKAYVALNNGARVAVIDTATNTVSTMVPITFPAYVAITSDGTRAYVTSPDTDVVSVIDTATDTILAAITAGDFPLGVATRQAAGTCSSNVASVAALRAEVQILATSRQTRNTLTRIVDNIQSALDRGNPKQARSRLADLVRSIVDLSNLAAWNADRIPLGPANHLVCGAANVLAGIPLP